MTRWWIALLLSICLIPNPQAKRYALVIGNASYADSPLDNPVNDASDMGNLLHQKGFEVTTLTDADERGMKEAIETFTRHLYEKNSVGLFYFAGHGVEVDGHNYLIPISADIRSEASVEFEAVDAGLVLSGMQRAGNDLNMVILDACRNNPYKSRFRSPSTGLAEMYAPKGSLLLYATSPGEEAADGEGRNGLFTEKLMQAIATPGLTVEDVFKQTAIAVYKATENSEKQQLPWQSGVILGDFYFTLNVAPKPDPVVSNPPIPNPQQTEDLAWQSILNESDPEYFEEYLKQYPRGRYAGIARVKIAAARKKPSRNEFQATLEQSTQLPKPPPRPESRQSFEPEMKRIPAKSKCFQMGDNQEQHEVCFAKDFAIGIYEVTQAQWQSVMGNNHSYFEGDDLPVENISWNDVQDYIQKLKQKTRKNYRLPSEAEWEYACRAGETHEYCGSDDVDSVA